MNEAQRFLRFVLPGVLYMVVAGGLLLLVRPDLLVAWKPYLDTTTGTAGVLGALMASGGIGFIFSMAHHEFDWRDPESPIDHRRLVSRLIGANAVEVVNVRPDRTTSKVRPEELTRGDAHDVVTALWHERVNEEPFKSVHPKMGSVLDVAYSLGIASWATLGGAVTAFGTAAWLQQWPATIEPRPVIRFAIAAFLSVMVWTALRQSYIRVGGFAARLIGATLMDAFMGRARPATTHILLK